MPPVFLPGARRAAAGRTAARNPLGSGSHPVCDRQGSDGGTEFTEVANYPRIFIIVYCFDYEWQTWKGRMSNVSNDERTLCCAPGEGEVHDMEKTLSSTEELLSHEEDIERASRSLKAMSHPLRLKILCTLGDREVSVQEIVEQVGTSQSNISQHLAILRDKGILVSRKDANRVFYRVGDARTLALIGMMREVFCTNK